MRRIVMPALFAVWSILLAGCVAAPPREALTVSLDEPVTLAIGESLAVDGGKLTFVAVPEDSRCPSQVACVWTGQAVVQLKLAMAGSPVSELHLTTIHSPAKTTQTVQAGYVIELQALEPYPETPDRTIPQRDYRATLAISPLATADCPLRDDDPNGYLTLICRYIVDNGIDVKPANQADYQIKEIQETTEKGRPVVRVYLNCCGMGDIAVIDSETGEVLSFRAGAF